VSCYKKWLSKTRVKIQRTPRSKAKIVHSDRLKTYEGPPLKPWNTDKDSKNYPAQNDAAVQCDLSDMDASGESANTEETELADNGADIDKNQGKPTEPEQSVENKTCLEQKKQKVTEIHVKDQESKKPDKERQQTKHCKNKTGVETSKSRNQNNSKASSKQENEAPQDQQQESSNETTSIRETGDVEDNPRRNPLRTHRLPARYR